MARKIAVFLVLFILVSVPLSASERVLVFRFRGTGVDEDLLDAVAALFDQALDGEGRYQAVPAFEVIGDVECREADCAAVRAREAGYGKAIIGSLTRLGSKVIVGVKLVDAAKRDVIQATEGAALSEEDLDVVLKRIAIAISKGKTIDATAEVGLITESEYTDVRKRDSFSTGGLRAGFMWPLAGSYGGVDRMTAIDLVFQHDTKDYFLAGKSGLNWGGDFERDGSSAFGLTLFEAKIGRYLSRNDFSPFVSAGLGISWTRIRMAGPEGEETDRGSGLSLSVGTGFAAFRTFDFQFQLGLDYIIILEKLGTKYGEMENPQGIFFTFCIRRGSGDD